MPKSQPMRFADFLKAENILCHLSTRDWKEAITQLATLLHKNEDSFDVATVVAACVERETASSTVIAPQFALPHARVENLENLVVAIGTSVPGIPFPAQERGLVHVVILILTPRADPGLYLQALAALTRDLSDPGAPQRLVECTTADDLYRLFAQKAAPLPPYLKARNLMNPRPVTLLESDTLKTAIDAFCAQQALDIPVVDEQRDLRGAVALEHLLRLSLPEHLLWLDDLSPIIHFEPFAELLRKDKQSKVADFMRDEYVAVSPEVPAIQLAKVFLTQNVRQILVVEKRKLLGTVDVAGFVANIFWA